MFELLNVFKLLKPKPEKRHERLECSGSDYCEVNYVSKWKAKKFSSPFFCQVVEALKTQKEQPEHSVFTIMKIVFFIDSFHSHIKE